MKFNVLEMKLAWLCVKVILRIQAALQGKELELDVNVCKLVNIRTYAPSNHNFLCSSM